MYLRLAQLRHLLNQNVTVAKSYETVTKNELIKNVSIVYYNWQHSWQRYNLLLQTDSIFADFETYANKKYNVGESNKLEKINATLQRKDLKIQVAQANTQVSFYWAELQKWMRTTQQYQAPSISCAWSRLNNYKEYFDFQLWVRKKFDSIPMDVEFRLFKKKTT